MDKNKLTKRYVLLSIIIFVVMIIMVAGISYAYIIKKIDGGDNTRVIIKTAKILLKYDEGDSLVASDVSPGWSGELDFSLENYSSEVNAKYKISLDIISPLVENEEENFVFTLTGESNKNENNFNKPLIIEETSVPFETTVLGEAPISMETIHNYTLKISLKENNQDQNYLKGKTFIAKVVTEIVY